MPPGAPLRQEHVSVVGHLKESETEAKHGQRYERQRGILQRPKRGSQKSNRQTHSAHGASPDGRHAVCEAACQEPPRPPQRPRRHKEPRHQGVRPESVLPVERRRDARHHDALGGDRFDDLLRGTYLQADETTVPVQWRKKAGANHQAYLWQYGRPGCETVFDFNLSRARGSS